MKLRKRIEQRHHYNFLQSFPLWATIMKPNSKQSLLSYQMNGDFDASRLSRPWVLIYKISSIFILFDPHSEYVHLYQELI